VTGAFRDEQGAESAAGWYDTNGNPTPTANEPLVDGGQFAPSSGASSGSDTVYINALDVFNLFNANTVLVRNNNILSTTFNQIAQNVSPGTFRIGVEVKF
jgi:hypothetical protein